MMKYIFYYNSLCTALKKIYLIKNELSRISFKKSTNNVFKEKNTMIFYVISEKKVHA